MGAVVITALTAVVGVAVALAILARRNDGACVVLWVRVLSGVGERIAGDREDAARAAESSVLFTQRRVAELRDRGEMSAAAHLHAESARFVAAAAEQRRLTRVLQRLIRAYRPW